MGRSALLLFLIACMPVAWAQKTTMYITDKLEVTLRSGQTTEHRIVKMIPSGTEVTVVETNAESGYSRIKTPSGDEGWVLTRYLLSEPSARDRLVKAEELIRQLQDEKQRAQASLSSLSTSQSTLQSEFDKAAEKAKRLEQELNRIKQTAANALLIDNENQANKQKLMAMERDYNALQLQVQALQDRGSRDWFIRGAGVLVGGIVLGVVLPRLRFKRKSAWGSL